MDEAEQDKYEARLKEVFDSFDTIGSGSLGREELTDLCHMLQLQEVAPVLLQTLLEENLSGRVHFEQFKEALILILSTTIEGNFSGDDSYQELESTEVQPKYVKDGKRYGRRTAPESQDSLEEVTGSLPKSDGRQPEHTPSRDDIENWKTSTEGEEYEAEGQLGFWNPDDLNTSQNVFGADPKWIEERLQAIAEELGVTKDSYLSSKELTSICDQCGLLNVDAEILDDIFQKLDQDGLMRLEDFLQGIFKKSAPPSASTPYRQLKRHHSLQPFDGSGRRTASPSAMTSTIGLHLFSCLDDGTGYTSADQILDAWQNEGIANGLEILKSLDFALYGKVNLSEFTLALENELLITKNGIHQAVLASFKNEIRYLMERADQISREKEKLRTDLEKAEKLKNLMASEVDDRHAAIEQLNECNLRKLEQEYKNRLAALKTDLTKEKDQFFLQANKQRIELEKEIEKERAEEGYLRDRLALALKENSRLEKELLENSEKLFESEILAKKLKHNLDTVLKEKFGGLDPTSAEFFLNEEKFKWLRNEYEQQFRELQDRIDELQSELQAYQTRGNGFKQLVASSLSEEMERKNDMGDCDPDFGLEECNLPNMSLEAEMAIEQIKEQHHQTIHSLKAEFEAKVNYYEEQMEETRVKYEMEKEGANQVHNNEIAKMKEEMKELENHVSHLQRETETIKNLQHSTEWKHREEKNELEYRFNIDKAQLEEQLRQEHETIQSKMEETSHTLCKEREELLERLNVTEVQMEVQRKELREAFRQEKMELEQAYSRQISELTENLQHEKEELQRNLLYNNQNELLQERKSMEDEFNQKISVMEAQFAKEQQTFIIKLKAETCELEEKYQQELQDLEKQLDEEKGQWEFEKEELLQENEEEKETLKAMLKEEKALFSKTLAEEKDRLEKASKDELNKVAFKHQRLQKELEELKATTSKTESILRNEIISLRKELHLQKNEEQVVKFQGKADQSPVFIEQVESEREKAVLKPENVRLEEKCGMTSDQLELSRGAPESKNEECSEICCLQERKRTVDEKLQVNNVLEGENIKTSSSGEMPQLEGETMLPSKIVYEEIRNENAESRTEFLEQNKNIEEVKDKAPDCLRLQEVNDQLKREKEEIMKVNFEFQEKVEKLQGKVTALTHSEAKCKLSEKEIRLENLGLKEKIKELEEKVLDVSDLQKTIDLFKNENTETTRRKVEFQERIEQLQETIGVLTVRCEVSLKELAEVRLQNIYLQESKMALESKTLELSNLQKAFELLKTEKFEMEKEWVKLEERAKLFQDKEKALTKLEGAHEESEKEIVRLQALNTNLQEKIKHLEEKVASISELYKRISQIDGENTELKVVVTTLQDQINQLHARMNSSESKELADESDILKDQKTTLKEEGDYHLKILEMNGAQQELIQQVEILKGDKMSAHKIIDVLNKEVVELTSWNQQLDIENEDLCQKNSKNQADVLELKQRLAELIRQKEKRAGNLQKWEEEKNNLMQEIENSHFSKCSKLEDEVTALRHTNEKLIREKETLSNEVSRCIEKLQNLEESLQSSNFQTAKLKSDFRVAQQEKEALKKEVMLLHKQLQATKDKIQVLEHTWDSADFQQQQKFYQDDLTRLMEEEQRLLREENERLQKEGELHIAREKVKQLESAILTLKHQKHYTKSTMLKAAEQEKLCMKREYDQIQKDLTRKLSLMISLEHEVKVLNVENEMLRKKQASLECQLMEMNEKLLQSNSNLTFSQTQNLRELQQMQEQICSMVPKEQLIHLQERLNLEEVQSRQLQEQLDVKTAETKMQQEAYEQLLKKMEERMQDVENKLRNIKLLLQDKVIQLKEQLSKNIKADEIVKDLYIENAQLLKALEMSEQRQKTTEKKNYLLEENIAGLNKILKDLSASSLSSASTCYSS
ncbi:ninein isoform X2 [Narcine bancroftii]|uniref:ninein isoform X2 n=1 Tax=Narcine bancroftii TaxID=1343680 RepID=UPI003832045E